MKTERKTFFSKHKYAVLLVIAALAVVLCLAISNHISNRSIGRGAAGADLVLEMKALYKDAGAVQYDVEPIKKFHFRKNTTFGEVKRKLKLDDSDFEKLAYCFEIEVPQGADLENEPLGKYISGALYEVTAVFPPEIEKSATHYGINPYDNAIPATLVGKVME